MTARLAIMNTTFLTRATRWLAGLLAAALVSAAASIAQAQAPDSTGATALRATHAELRSKLDHSAFQRPLHLDSRQAPGTLHGDIHAVIDHSFATVETQVRGAAQWCEILMLHLNVKHCAPGSGDDGEMLAAHIGKKTEQPLDRTHRVAFRYQVTASSTEYLQIRLDAGSGPFGTRDYRIMFEAIPLDAGRTFVHLAYSYGYGPVAAIAMRAYFGTAGSAKVGFTVLEHDRDGQPVRVSDIRGALERNTMRYFLAIDAHLGARSVPPQARRERRLHDWFAATERYALQLHEVEQDEYLAMKRNEYERMLAQR